MSQNLNHITYQNTFNFRYCASYFVNKALGPSIFHVFSVCHFSQVTALLNETFKKIKVG